MRVSPAGANQDLGQSERRGNETQPRVRGKGKGESRAGRSPWPCPPPTHPLLPERHAGEICAPQRGETPPGDDGTRRRRGIMVKKTYISAGNRNFQHRGRDDDPQTLPSLHPALNLRANHSVHGRLHFQHRLVVEHTPKQAINFCSAKASPVGRVQGTPGRGTAQVVSSTGGTAHRKSQETE